MFVLSMIEMLGVLAIIGVLSVGGIAGYSQTMTKYKVNQTIDEYMHLFRGLIEYEDSLKKLPGAEIDGAGQGLADFVLAANLVSETWKKKSGRKCLSSLTLSDINAACDGCKGSSGCYINMEF